jgi:AcrR family transcriptional regulator
MPKRTQASAASRKPLSRDRVLKAAIGLADVGGIEALSMRKLAQKLGVEAMSLYNHVANKDEIVDGMLELVAQEIELPADGADWKAAVRSSAVSAHEAFRRHRWAAGLWMTRGGVSPTRLRYGDSVLRTFREAGFSEDLTYHAFHTFQAHVVGYTMQELNFPFDKEELKQLAATFLREFPVDEYPHLAEHIAQHVEPSEVHGGTFEFGLDLMLDGLERLRDMQEA